MDQSADSICAATARRRLPITLRAQTPGQVLLNGNSKINISGNWLVVDGLKFEGGALAADDHVVEFRGSRGEATNSRLTNSAIIDYNPASVDTRYFWVSLYGQHNRVDHNYFKNQNHSGVTVVVWRSDSGPDYHQIDANYFADRPLPVNPADPNGFETIRIGDSTDSLSNSFTTVENNLFERTDGEIEVISNKSGSNTLSLQHVSRGGRHAHAAARQRQPRRRQLLSRATIRTTPARFASSASGRRSSTTTSPMSTIGPAARFRFRRACRIRRSTSTYQVKDAVIAHNTIVNVGGPAMTFDDGLGSSGRTLLAQNVTVANNLLRSNGADDFRRQPGHGLDVAGQHRVRRQPWARGRQSGRERSSIRSCSSAPTGCGGPGRPARRSTAAAGNYSGLITTDMDGQARIGIYDVGADEVSAATIVRRPLTAADVGPAGSTRRSADPLRRRRRVQRGRLCDSSGELCTRFSIPTATAICGRSRRRRRAGGQVIKAPNGSTVILPGTHETIATYDMTFANGGHVHGLLSRPRL